MKSSRVAIKEEGVETPVTYRELPPENQSLSGGDTQSKLVPHYDKN